MNRLLRLGKIALTDALGIICLVGAVAFGWLPGPGGIPLFIIGLSLLAIHHPQIKKYIDVLQDYAHHLGDLFFVKNPRIQMFYDLLGLILLIPGVYLLWQHNYLWHIPLGSFCLFMAVTIFLGNRQRL